MSILTDSEIAGLSVKRIAFHQVGGPAGVMHFSEPTATQMANGFFADRIRSVCVGSVFRFEPNSTVRRYCQLLHQQRTKFLTNSSELATLFHDMHRTQMQVGNFMVFLLETGDLKLVAMMKYDNQEVVRALFSSRQPPAFRILQDAFVKDRDAIQKSAIVRLGNEGGAELIVTDRSQKGGLVTDYFRRFLSAVPVRDNVQATEVVFEEARRVLKDIAKEKGLPAQRQRALSAQMRDALVDGMMVDTTDASVLVARMTIPEIPVDEVLPELEKALKRKQIYGETFAIDSSSVPRRPPRHIETREGVKIFAPPDAASRVVVSPDGRKITISTAGVLSDDGISDPPP